jgi:hypothetical protein
LPVESSDIPLSPHALPDPESGHGVIEHGNRGGVVADPFGYQWMVTTQTEEVSPEEMQRRFNAACA